MRKRLVLGLVAAAVAVPVLVVAGGLAGAFWGLRPAEPGRELAEGRVVTVVDGYVSCFLVDAGGGAWVLVDACADPEATAVHAALAARGATPDDVRLVLLTHGHSDHVGGLAALPGVPVRAAGAELPYLEGRATWGGPLPGLQGAVDTGVRVREPVRDGERIDVGDATVEVFTVPGHTAGSAVYLVHGVLLLGDSATVLGDGRVVGAPWVFSDDTAVNVASLRALAGRLAGRSDVAWVQPAHSGPGEGLAGLAAL